MKILDNFTGSTTATCLPITKSPGTIFCCFLKTLAELTNETVTIRIERTNGNDDVFIARDMNLRKFILGNLKLNNSNLSSSATYKTIAPIELGLEAGVKLLPNEKIHISFTKLTTASTYDLSYVEDRENTTSHVVYEVKSIGIGEVEKEFLVQGMNVVMLDNTADLTEVGLKIAGKDFRFTPEELRNGILHDDPFIGIDADGKMITDFPAVLTIDLLGVDSLTIYKTGTSTTSVLFASYGELKPKTLQTANSKFLTGSSLLTPKRL